MKFLPLFLTLLAVIATSIGYDILRRDWEEWKATYGKAYSVEEDSQKRMIWEKNLLKIAQHNAEADFGIHSFRLQMNQYGDLEESDWKRAMMSSVKSNGFCNHAKSFQMDNLPDSVDWRTKGAVFPVQDQGSNGKSWTYSATGALEGQNFIKHGRLVKLSEQNLADCATANFSRYCEIGGVDCAFYYVTKNGGIDTEEGYPGTHNPDGKCQYTPLATGATCMGCVDLPSANETALQEAIASVGPVSVNIDASHPSFQLYKSGIYYEPECSSTRPDHAVLVVGYGKQDGKEFWIVRNSWGSSWGVEGYIMMSRNKDNNCGIASEASYPLM